MIVLILIGIYLLGALVVFFIPAFTGKYLTGYQEGDPMDIVFSVFWPIVIPIYVLWKWREKLVQKKRKFEKDKREILR
jgi:hypothetical protein